MKAWKKVLCIFTALSTLVCSVPLLADSLDSGVTEDGFVWEQGGAKTCYVIGYEGTEKNIVIPTTIDKYTVSAVQKYAFKDSYIESVVMKSNVEYVCVGSFQDCKSLKSVTVSPKTESLQIDSFNGCSALTDVTIPEGVKQVDKQAFKDCTSLESIKLPEGLKDINNNAFNGCINLKSIELPTTLLTIGNAVFYNCTSFCTTTIYESLKSIGANAFLKVPETAVITVSTVKAYNQLIKADFKGTILGAPVENPADYTYKLDGGNAVITGYKGTDAKISVPAEIDGHTVTAIDDDVFKDKAFLEKVYLNVPLVSVGDSAFEGCTSLYFVSLPEDFAQIGEKAFYGCNSLKTISIPMSVNKIGTDAFKNISSQSVISVSMDEVKALLIASGYNGEISFVPENNPDDYVLMTGSAGAMVKSYTGEKSKISIPQKMSEQDGFTTVAILAYGFANNNDITSVIVPDTVTWIGDYGFCNCANLKKLVLPRKLANISAHMLEGSQSLTSVNIPDTVEEIGDYAFRNCYSLAEIEIPEGVTEIGTGAFEGCTALKSITIPSTVKKFGKNAFQGISTAATINVPTLDIYYTLKAAGCNVNINVIGYGLDCPTDISIVSGNAKGKGTSGKYTGTALEVIIPSQNGDDKATSFPTQMFYKNTTVTCITVANGIEKLPASSFSGCTALKKLTLPSTLTKIGSSSFKSLPADAVIEVPNKAVYDLVVAAKWTGEISGYAVSDASQFTYERVPDSTYEAQITGYIGTADKIAIPQEVEIGGKTYTVTKIKENALKGTAIKQVILPDTVFEIGTGAFSECADLTEAVLSNRLTAIGEAAFKDDTKLKKVNLCDDILVIKASAFENTGLEEITLPKFLMKIKEKAFLTDTLVKVDVPDTVEEIEKDAFSSKTVVSVDSRAVNDLLAASGFTGAVEGVPVTNLADYEYLFTQNNTRATITKYKGTDSIIAIPDEISGIPVKAINANAFAFNEYLVKVHIPDTVTVIGNNAFEGCVNIEHMNMPKQLTEIGSRTFQTMVSLRELEFHEGITVISFHSCRFLFSLRKLVLPQSVVTIQDTAFYFDSALRQIVLPENVIEVGASSFATNSELTEIFCNEKVAELLNGVTVNGKVTVGSVPPESESTPRYIRFNNENEISKIYTLPDDGTEVTFDKKEQAAKITVGEKVKNTDNCGTFYLFSDGQSAVYNTNLPSEEFPYLVMNIKTSSNNIKIGKGLWSTTYSREICGKDIHPGRGNETFIDCVVDDYKNTSDYQTVVVKGIGSDFFSGDWVSIGLTPFGTLESKEDYIYIKDARLLTEDEYFDYISTGASTGEGSTLVDFSLESNFDKMAWSDLSDTFAEYLVDEGAAFICARDAVSGTYADEALNYDTAHFEVSFASVPVEEYPILAIRLKLLNPDVNSGWFCFKTTDSVKDSGAVFCDILKPIYANTTEWQTIIIDCSKNNIMGHLFTGNWLGAAFNLTSTATASENDKFLVEWAGIFKNVDEAIAAGQASVKTYTPPQEETKPAAAPTAFVDGDSYSIEEEAYDPEYEYDEKVRSVKKKRSVFIPGKDYTAIVVIASVGGGILLAGATTFFIILARKKKNRKGDSK